MTQGDSATPQTRVILHALLGEGRYGQVYRATLGQAGTQRPVAVKVLRRQFLSDEDALERLLREGRILGQLRHPAIVAFEGRVDVDGRPGIVMELVEGAGLDDVLKRSGPLPGRACLEIAQQVAAAFESVTRRDLGHPDLVHRDLKPANLLVGSDGRVRIVDFGLARALEPGLDPRTGAGSHLGTVAYWAPECLAGTDQTGSAADVFALGATWLEAALGTLPWADSTLGQWMQMNASEAAHDLAIRGAVQQAPLSPPAQALLLQMLGYNATDRPDWRAVAARCDAILPLESTASLQSMAEAHAHRLPPAQLASLVGEDITVVDTPPATHTPTSENSAVPGAATGPPRPPAAHTTRLTCGLTSALFVIVLLSVIITAVWLRRPPSTAPQWQANTTAPVDAADSVGDLTRCPPLQSAGVRAAAQQAKLGPEEVGCLDTLWSDSTRSPADRRAAGELLWQQQAARCTATGSCESWVDLLHRWPADLGPVDPLLSEQLALDLHRVDDSGRYAAARERWAAWALAHGTFVGTSGLERNLSLLQAQTYAAFELAEQDPADDARARAARVAGQWRATLVRAGRPDAEVHQLCVKDLGLPCPAQSR